MNMYARSNFTGNYTPQGNIAKADCVVGHEFSNPGSGFGVVNEALARFIAERHLEQPLFLNRNIAGALKRLVPRVDLAGIFEGGSTKLTITGDRGTGTWGELLQAQQFMEEAGLEHPIAVAQAYHVGRVALQAKRLGIEPIIPEGLPKIFDPESLQAWTKGYGRWAIYSALAPVYLKLNHQI